MDSQQERTSRQQRHGIGGIGWAVIGTVFFGSLLAIGILPRLSQRSELEAAVKEASTLPSVNVMTAHRAAATTNLELPGSVVALNQTTIYARSTGYLRRWYADIGDRVQAGQLLAEIDSPDTDQQVLQAKAELAQAQANVSQTRASLAKGVADLKQARANLLLALQSWQRWKVLVNQGAVAQQDADTRYATYQANLANVEAAQNTVNSDSANVEAAQANVFASRANFQRYSVLQSYKKVTAPFAGVITARNVNSGALITGGTGNTNTSNTTSTSNTTGTSSTNTSLYTIAAYDALNVNVSVPQSSSALVQAGQTAQITVRELPQRVFSGKVVRTSNAIDPNTRTLLTQLEVQNLDGALRPGMYATVKFAINRPNPPFVIPGSALVVNAEGTQVATVTKNQTVHYQKVGVGRDYGTEIEITSGLTGNESLITTPTVDETEGLRVQPVAQKAK
ncbi:MAG: efflux RND transporter periplasmic adaptor subunit [Brasilonema octagenarum HA4186-MV1]|jgi:multidrug efflux pump subunit AcrA (membrane-fusion protein)|uniref:Efflux RND transporter periplasmic adaptor subunit n=1 Tax=Brasilonema octagenarum UFV-OR1 TaxID=417115 RepID=A0ABX1MHU5_9CYAN|nr:efflux RND transporter periplasmic adaptor subunit [Brasilonema octagenarum]MBW4629760.1 efflux RND transporter periplasmic adaptor subunit [Brasilonema octagenarum HA4186-MV1]NMF65457.1 efflux RND transporter periplasmic adaptor subunit [Brasilonema octagenarum UFV-OR1]